MILKIANVENKHVTFHSIKEKQKKEIATKVAKSQGIPAWKIISGTQIWKDKF